MADSLEQIEDLTDALAAAPKQVAVDGQSVVEHSIPDMIALEQHRANTQAASRSRGIGIRFFGLKMPSAIGGCE